MSAAPISGTIDELVERSAAAFEVWSRTTPDTRANALDAIAAALDAAADGLIATAHRESHLTEGRLRGELTRTTFQLRLFADQVRDGGFLDARVDHADGEWPMGAPRPDLRRILEPIGPVVVFAASNFPFAFSVAGGDTASAFAAGCSVVLKVNPGHPELSAEVGTIVRRTLTEAGLPADALTLVSGVDEGLAVLRHPLIKAGSFTGSIAGGRALFDAASARPEPIPFYGELGSVNPVFVTRSADAARGAAIADEFIASFTLGAGQFCTKPGVLMVPEGSAILGALAAAELPVGAPMLNERIRYGFSAVVQQLAGQPGVHVQSQASLGDELGARTTLLRTSADALLADLEGIFREAFGPASLVVTYRDESELVAVADAIDGQLTASIFGEPDDEIAPALVQRLARKAGRLLWNQWPTGVSVTYAQQHGGPYPATTSPTTTSVGTAATARFLRPVAYQGFPDALLPQALSEHPETAVPRLLDGDRR